MVSVKLKTFVVVSVLLVLVSLIAVGCRHKPTKATWVNTNSMPGRTFSKYIKHEPGKKNPTIVYLGSDSNSSSSTSNFGPRDVSFEFQELK